MRTGKIRTICEVLREINDLIQEDTEKNARARELLNEASYMSKKIVRKLLSYNKKACVGFWKKNPQKERQINYELRRGLDYKPIKRLKNDQDTEDSSSGL